MAVKFKNILSILFFSVFAILGPKANAFEVGVATHFSLYKKPVTYYLDLMNQYGITSFRTDFFWHLIEESPNSYHVNDSLNREDYAFSNAHDKNNISSMLILGYSNPLHTKKRDYPRTEEQINAFANYAHWTATRYKGKVKYYEIWNEWLNGTGNMAKPLNIPSNEIFLELVKKTAAAIKSADPDAIILSGSFSPMDTESKVWFDALVKLGILNYIDGVSLHPYTYYLDNKSIRTPEGNLQFIDKYQKELSKLSGREIPFYITEMGVPTYTGRGGLDENNAAKFVTRYILLAKTYPFIKGIWWYDLQDDGLNPKNRENNFGLFNYHTEPKLAVVALKQVIDLATHYDLKNSTISSGGLITLDFSKGNSTKTIIWQDPNSVVSADKGFASFFKSFNAKKDDDFLKNGQIQTITESQVHDLIPGVPYVVNK